VLCEIIIATFSPSSVVTLIVQGAKWCLYEKLDNFIGGTKLLSGKNPLLLSSFNVTLDTIEIGLSGLNGLVLEGVEGAGASSGELLIVPPTFFVNINVYKESDDATISLEGSESVMAGFSVDGGQWSQILKNPTKLI
jgi:hypothetical protein